MTTGDVPNGSSPVIFILSMRSVHEIVSALKNIPRKHFDFFRGMFVICLRFSLFDCGVYAKMSCSRKGMIPTYVIPFSSVHIF